jgi:hypothetical protein
LALVELGEQGSGQEKDGCGEAHGNSFEAGAYQPFMNIC